MTESFDYPTAARLSRAARDAFTMLDRISALPDDECDISIALRNLLIDRDADDMLDCPDAAAYIDIIRDSLAMIDARIAYPYDEHARHSLSMLMLDYSLCPMHACDYAICFDDRDDDCAAIRAFFPIHDT